MAPVAVVLVRPLDNPWGKVDEWMVQALAGVGSRPGYVLLLLTSSPGEHSPLTGAPQVPPPPLAPPRSPTTAGATQTRALVPGATHSWTIQLAGLNMKIILKF